VVLLFANGKEVHREARIIDFTRLTQQILRYQEALTSVEEQDSYESLFDQLDE
ncbi:MAG: thioredoxin, partial [Enterococcus casseliflavus]